MFLHEQRKHKIANQANPKADSPLQSLNRTSNQIELSSHYNIRTEFFNLYSLLSFCLTNWNIEQLNTIIMTCSYMTQTASTIYNSIHGLINYDY